MIRIGSLFSGIGGLELGLERAIPDAHVVWQVEIDLFCRRVLAKHWPEVKQHADVRNVNAGCLEPVDLICGGFPCQDVSSAGKRAGLAGAKSGLWYEYRRIVAELLPRFVVVENVTSGKKLWLPTVRGDLEGLGYRTRAYALSAADVGAPHLRRRVFVVADFDGDGLREQSRGSSGASREEATLARELGQESVGYAVCVGRPRTEGQGLARRQESPARGWWTSEPAVGRVAYGVSGGVDGRRRRARLRALGNAVVPQCAEVIGRVIAEAL